MSTGKSTSRDEPGDIEATVRGQAEYVSFLRGFLNMLDGLERWSDGAEGETRRRIEVVQQHANRLLLLHGIRQTARPGRRLDLRYHEVVGTESDGSEPDTILRVLQMGYEIMIQRGSPLILRAARVIVAVRPQDVEHETPEDEVRT